LRGAQPKVKPEDDPPNKKAARQNRAAQGLTVARKGLLHHAFDEVTDDGELEFFALVRLVHAVDPDDEKAHAQKGCEQPHEPSDRDVQRRGDQAQHQGQNPESDPNSEKGDIEHYRLRTVELDKGPPVDQQEDQSRNLVENIAEQPGDIFLQALCGGCHRRDRRSARRRGAAACPAPHLGQNEAVPIS
jgi:hypothetical protein